MNDPIFSEEFICWDVRMESVPHFDGTSKEVFSDEISEKEVPEPLTKRRRINSTPNSPKFPAGKK